ncbi:right-handed parallel beta-helix repeat-containing protein [Cohnella yongneupensis]|uniref:Right-handed parallel beta-helix repeat-containing protein n=1 Tax=Cohnella yongneupensis TaxID=425006 RepID=A0ABW0R464_9BACL
MDYYVSLNGEDRNSGKSPQEAWSTIDRVNEEKYNSGDRILFEGGKSFAGTVRIKDVTAEEPVVICSFGDDRALIDGGAGSGIVVDRCNGVRITSIDVRGAGRNAGNRQGVGIGLIDSSQIDIDQVRATGFQKAGVAIDGCSHIRLTHVLAQENGYAGITTFGRRSHEIYIGYCKAINNPGDPTITDNHSGSGIVLFNVQDAMVEYCEAAENGWDMQQINSNGPVGIWTACGADRVTIQYCISHHNRSPQRDGGGFDFDGGTTNSLMQFNYAYENNGCGYLLCQYGGGDPVVNNTIRYCISENDGQGDHNSGIYTYLADGRIYDCDIHNNVIYNEHGRGCVVGAMPDSRFSNNIFILKGSGVHVKEAEFGSFQGNVYRTIDGPTMMDETGTLSAEPEMLKELEKVWAMRVESPLRQTGLHLNKTFGVQAE